MFVMLFFWQKKQVKFHLESCNSFLEPHSLPLIQNLLSIKSEHFFEAGLI